MTAKIIFLPIPERVADASVFEQREGQSAVNELRRARIRIAQLEASLSEAMRDSLANFNRARAAERSLEQMLG